MCAAVEEVALRNREQPRVRAFEVAEVAIERLLRGGGGGVGDRQRDGQDRVRAQAALVGRAVDLDHRPVHLGLAGSDHAGEPRCQLPLHVLERRQHPVAAVAPRIAVAQLHRLVRAGGGAARHGGATERAVVERDVDLDRGVAARVQDLARPDVGDRGARHPHPLARPGAHAGAPSSRAGEWRTTAGARRGGSRVPGAEISRRRGGGLARRPRADARRPAACRPGWWRRWRGPAAPARRARRRRPGACAWRTSGAGCAA